MTDQPAARKISSFSSYLTKMLDMIREFIMYICIIFTVLMAVIMYGIYWSAKDYCAKTEADHMTIFPHGATLIIPCTIGDTQVSEETLSPNTSQEGHTNDWKLKTLI